MEHSFATMFENIRHERSLILLLSLTDSDVLRQSKVTDDEINILKNLALEYLHRQRILKICCSIVIRKGSRILFSV